MITPAAKLPLASRATTVLAVFNAVALLLIVIAPVLTSIARPVPVTAALVTPLLVNVTVSVPALVVIVKPVLPANVNVSVAVSASTLLCPLTAIIWNLLALSKLELKAPVVSLYVNVIPVCVPAKILAEYVSSTASWKSVIAVLGIAIPTLLALVIRPFVLTTTCETCVALPYVCAVTPLAARVVAICTF